MPWARTVTLKQGGRKVKKESTLTSSCFNKQNLIAISYDDKEISFSEGGWFNATAAAAYFGKRVADWIENKDTQNYILILSETLEVPKKALLKVKRGGKGKSDATWFHPKLAVPFARWLDVKFAIWCDCEIDKLIRGNHPRFDWKRVRHEATSSYKVMNAVLQLVRQNNGKPTQFFHYANEAKLVNWAITGEFKPLDRDSLNHEELDLLAKLEERNAVLVGCGLGREDRKLALSKFASEFKYPIMIQTETNILPI
jgi:hypothetical protein